MHPTEVLHDPRSYPDFDGGLRNGEEEVVVPGERAGVVAKGLCKCNSLGVEGPEDLPSGQRLARVGL